MTQGISPEIVVIGSANADLVTRVERLPAPGETVLATGYEEHPGGKGANQAIAAARLGRAVSFVGVVGEDGHAGLLTQALTAAGVDVAPTSPPSGPGGGAERRWSRRKSSSSAAPTRTS